MFLILSPSPALLELLRQWRGQEVHYLMATDTAQAAELLRTYPITLVIIDIPVGEEFLALCKAKAPVILLSGTPSQETHATKLQKPLRAEALFNAITACLPAQEKPLLLDGIYFFVREKFLSSKSSGISEQDKVKLTEKESAILCFLHAHKEKTVDKEMLLAGVWGYQADMDTHTLETHLYRLRQKISTNFDGKEIVVTQSGGYRLAGE